MYVATINIPGYLPMDDYLVTFDTATEAWEYLAGDRQRDEDTAVDDDTTEYSETLKTLRLVASDGRNFVTNGSGFPIDAQGIGTVYGPTPGYDGTHDLGLAYSVSVADDCTEDDTEGDTEGADEPLGEDDPIDWSSDDAAIDAALRSS